MGLRDFAFGLLVIVGTVLGAAAWLVFGLVVLAGMDYDLTGHFVAVAPFPLMYSLVIADLVAYGESVERYPVLRPHRAVGLVAGTMVGTVVGDVFCHENAAPFIYGVIYGLPISWLFDRAWYTLLRPK